MRDGSAQRRCQAEMSEIFRARTLFIVFISLSYDKQQSKIPITKAACEP